MANWFESCLSVKLYKKGMDTEMLKGLASAFIGLHFYANYCNNTIIIIGDSKEIDDAVGILRYKLKGKILTSCYSTIPCVHFQSSKEQKEPPK
jgi:hypothetical protein